MKISGIRITETNLPLARRAELLRKAGYPEAAERLISDERKRNLVGKTAKLISDEKNRNLVGKNRSRMP